MQNETQERHTRRSVGTLAAIFAVGEPVRPCRAKDVSAFMAAGADQKIETERVVAAGRRVRAGQGAEAVIRSLPRVEAAVGDDWDLRDRERGGRGDRDRGRANETGRGNEGVGGRIENEGSRITNYHLTI